MARKDAIEVEGTVVELLPNTMFRVKLPNGGASSPTSREKCGCTSFASYLARRQSYARDFTLRFVEGANHVSPKVTTRRRLRVFRLVDYESTTISKKTLCKLQDREAQKRGARDLQEPAP
jgi:hypothetical protein